MKNRTFWIISILPFILLFLICIPFCMINLVKSGGFYIVSDELVEITDLWINNISRAIRGERPSKYQL